VATAVKKKLRKNTMASLRKLIPATFFNYYRCALVNAQQPITFRNLSLTFTARCSENTEESADKPEAKKIAPEKDRTKVIPLETSIKYLASDAYKQTYGVDPVWTHYRRNHKGPRPPRKTRKTCVRSGVLATGNPCPICRDEYLLLDHRNLHLLRQFISPQTGQVLSYQKTGLCQKTHLQLLVAVERAKDLGLITFDVPFREFDYSEYYGKAQQ
jgi:small subunit ribosomal protein S18b, mitochondrial